MDGQQLARRHVLESVEVVAQLHAASRDGEFPGGGRNGGERRQIVGALTVENGPPLLPGDVQIGGGDQSGQGLVDLGKGKV